MNRPPCELIGDLLPLYLDDVASPASRAAVEEHLAGCPARSARLQRLRQNAALPAEDDAGALRAMRRRARLRALVPWRRDPSCGPGP